MQRLESHEEFRGVLFDHNKKKTRFRERDLKTPHAEDKNMCDGFQELISPWNDN